MRSRILGAGHAVPSTVLTNEDLSRMVATSDEWIRERTGIGERRVLEKGRVTSDLAAEAGARACRASGIEPADLDCIICGTISPDMPLPAVAVAVQQKIGASCAAFDLAAACAGFIYGLSIADAMVRAGTMKRVLVIGVEILSRWLDWSDRNTCVLFGDGAGAVVVGPSAPGESSEILSTHLFADGSGMPMLNIPGGGTAEPASHETVEARRHYVKMNGKAIFAHAVKQIASAAKTALEVNKLEPAQIDWVVPHQANLRILESIAERLGLPMSRFYLNIHKYGNTSSASIPLALSEGIEEGKIKRGHLVLMAALGAGLSWGSAVVRL